MRAQIPLVRFSPLKSLANICSPVPLFVCPCHFDPVVFKALPPCPPAGHFNILLIPVPGITLIQPLDMSACLCCTTVNMRDLSNSSHIFFIHGNLWGLSSLPNAQPLQSCGSKKQERKNIIEGLRVDSAKKSRGQP